MKNFTPCFQLWKNALANINLKKIPHLVLALFLLGGMEAKAQSYRTVGSFTGTTADFTTNEKYSSVDNVDYYVTFDANYIYFGAFRTNNNTWGQFDHLNIYVDADAKSGVTSGGSGTTTGVNWDGNTPTLPIQADYKIALRRNNSGESFYSSYSGSWSTGSANAKGYSQYATSTANGALEIRVPWTDLGSPSGIYFIMYASYSTGYYGSAPNGTSGAGPASGKYFGGIGVSSAGCYPTNTISTPIIDAYSGGAPTSGQLYGKVTLTGSSITLTGNTTVAPGGSLVLASGVTFGVQSGKTLNMASGSSLTNNSGSTTPFTNLTATLNFNLSTNYTTITGSVSYINGSSTTTVPSTVSLALNAGVDFGASSNTTVNGTVTLNNGGYVSTNPPVYAAGTLIYASGTTYTAGSEWVTNASSGAGVPNNVQIGASATTNNTVLTFGSSSGYRQVLGALTITNLTTGNGLILSSSSGGDLYLAGNFSAPQTAASAYGGFAGGFNGNGRAVFFTSATSAITTQSVTGPSSGAALTIPYVVFGTSASSATAGHRNVQLGADLIISAPNGGNAVIFDSSYLSSTAVGDAIIINGKTLTIGTSGQSCSTTALYNTGRSTIGTIKGSSTSNLVVNGNGGSTFNLNLDNGGGSSGLNTLTLNQPITLLTKATIYGTGSTAGIVLNGSSMLTFAPTAANFLYITGDINIASSGSIDATSANATVAFSGAAAQSIPAGTFNTSTVNNLAIIDSVGGATLNQSLTVTGNTQVGTSNQSGILIVPNGVVLNTATLSLTSSSVVGHVGTLTINGGSARAVYGGSSNGTVVYTAGNFNTASGTTTLTVNGYLKNSVSSTINPIALTFGANSLYEHATNGGTIPTPTSGVWPSNATVYVTGMSSTAPSGLTQNFGRFIWNCASQTADVQAGSGFGTQDSLYIQATNVASPSTVRNFRLGVISATTAYLFGNIYVGSASGNTALLDLNYNGTITTDTASKVTLLASGTLKATASSSLFLKGDWSNAGTFTSTNIPVTFNGTSVQAINGTTSFNALTVNNAAGVNANTDVTVSGLFTQTSGTLTIASAKTLTIGGTLSYTAGGIDASASTATVAFTNSGALTLNAGFFNANVSKLTLNGAGGVTLGAALTVSNTLTLTSGIITTTASNLLTLSNTANTAVSGGTTTSFVNGPLIWNLPSGGSSSTYTFPVGAATTYLPLALAAPSGTGALTATIQAFLANSGGSASGTLSSISTTEYWSISTTGSFTGASVSLTRQSTISPLNVIASSTTSNGAYISLGGTPAASSVTGSNNTGSTTPQYFLFAQVSTPTVTSVTANSPITGQTALGNGYFGQTVAIVGTNFASDATVSFNGTTAASLTYNSATSLTATIPNGCTTGVVTVTNPSTTLSANSSSFNILGYLSVASTDWNTTTTWAGSVVPALNSTVTINTSVTLTGNVTNAPTSITINSTKSLILSSTGTITATTVVNNGTFTLNASGATLNIAAGGTFTNNGTSTSTNGTVNFAGAGTVNGSSNTTFYNFTINTGIVALSTVPTINGTFTINGGNITASPIYGASSTLTYAVSYGRYLEWNATGSGTIGTTQGYPNNVTVTAGTLDIPNGTNNVARAMNGTFTIASGATATMSAMTNALSIAALSNTGTLTLSTVSGGDLNVTGALGNTGTFTPNLRLVTFNGSSAQTITGTTTFDYVTLNNSAGLTLGTSTNATINKTLTLTAGTFTVAANTLTIASTLSVSSGNIDASNSSATVVFNGSAAQSIPNNTFTSTVKNLTISNTNSSTGATLNQNITVNGTLLVSSGGYFTIPNAITLSSSSTVTVTGTMTVAGTGLSSAATIGGVNNGTVLLSGSGVPTINGTLAMNGYWQHGTSAVFTLGVSPTMTFGANSVYEITNINYTSLPFVTATNPLWNSNSNIIVTNMSNANPLIATTSSGTILGNVTYQSTRTLVYLADANTNGFKATVAGNITFNNPTITTRSFIFGDPGVGGATNINDTINIGGDFTATSWTGLLNNSSGRTFTGCNYVFNFAGNFIAPGSVSGTSGNGLQSGALTAGQNTINFTGTGKYLNYNLNLANAATNITGSYSLYNVWNVTSTNVTGSLTCYDNTLAPFAVTNGTFTLADGATIKTNSATGLNGSITTGSTRTWGIATYQFDAPASAAATITGSYLPTTAIANLIINNTSGVALTNSSSTVNTALTLISGALSLNAKTINIASSGVLNNSGGSIATTNTNGSDGGTISFLGTGTVNGSALTFYNLSVAGGTTLLNASPTINGVFTINTNGFISTNSPYYGTSSTLFYNQAGAYNRSIEWLPNTTSSSAAGYPNNVTIGSSTQAGAFNLRNVTNNLQMGGNLTIGASSGSASSLTMDEATTPRALTVVGNVVINATGTLTLGNLVSGNAGDLYVKGNFTRSGTFVPNSRAVFFTGSSAQTITGATTFDYLIINNTSGGVSLAASSACAVNQTLTLTSGLLSTANSNLTIASTGNVSGGSTTSYIDGPLLETLAGSLTSSGTYSFPVGNSGTYLPLTLLNVTTGATGPTITVTATNSGSGGTADGTGVSSISGTEYWKIATSASGTYSGGTVNITRQTALGSFNMIAKSTTLSGTYSAIGGTTSGTTITGIATPGTGSIATNSSIYLAMAVAVGGTPTITSVTANSPITGQTALGNGYFGQSVAIVGSGFVSGATVSFNGIASPSVTFNSSTSLTATIPALSTAGVVTVTNPNTYSGNSSSFNQLGYVTTADGIWNGSNTAIWLGGAVPATGYPITLVNAITLGNTISNSPAGITIASGASLTQSNGSVTSTGAVLNNGTWSLSNGTFTTGNGVAVTNAGSLTISGGTFTTGTSVVFTNSGTWSMTNGTINIGASGTLTNNSTASLTGGTISFTGAATVNGSTALTFNNININTGTVALSTVPTINGTFTINGGNVSAAPIYTASSTLSYATSYSRFNEWSATGVGTIGTTAGYPNNVTIAGTATTVDVSNSSNTARALNGALTINSGNTLTMSAMTGLLTASRVSIAGTLTLSSANGGDLAVTGTSSGTGAAFYLNGGTFTPNGRALFLSATAGTTQYIGNATATVITIPYLVFSNASNLILNSDVSFTAPSGGSAISFPSGGGTLSNFININGYNMVVGTASQTANVSGTLYVKGGGTGTSSTLSINGASGTISLNVDGGGGNSFLNTLTINHPGVTLVNNSNTYVQNSLVLTSGTLNIAPSSGTVNFQIGGTVSRTSGNINASTSAAIVTFNGTSAQTFPSSTFSGSIYKLVINNTASTNPGITIPADLTISNNLTLTAGLISTGANTVIMSSGASISTPSASSYIDGKLKQTYTSASAKTFPVGKGGNYRPVVFTYTANPTNKDVTIEQFESGNPLTIPSTASTARLGNRFWNIAQSATGTNYTVGLNNGGFTPTGTVSMLRREGTGSTTSNAVSFSTPTYTNSTSFSTTNTSNDVALVESAIPLTVTGVIASNKSYTGTNTATLDVSSAALSGVQSPDVVTLSTGSATGTFASVSVGTGITVNTAGFTISGANANAYTLTQPSTTANITTASLTITANAVNKTYGTTITGGSGSTAFTPSGLQNSETVGSVTIAYGSGAAATDAIATYTGSVTPSAATGGTFTASNYSISYAAGNLNVIAGAAGNWVGLTSTDFSTASNWADNALPTSSTNIVIPTGTTYLPVLSADATIANLSIASAKTIGLGGNTLTINGAVSGTGTITGSATSSLVIGGTAGTISFTGGAKTLKNFTINSSSSVTLGDTLNITAGSTPGTVTVGSGSTLSSGGYLILKSDINGTARVAASAGTISGNVTVERYITAKSVRRYGILGSPVRGSTIRNGWQQQVYITGAGTGGTVCGSTTGNGGTTDKYNSNGFDKTQAATPSMYTYSVNGSGTPSWTSVANTTSINTVPGTGYLISIRGDRNAGASCADQLNTTTPTAPATVTLSATGTLGQGDTTVNLNDPSKHLYTLLGNPYPSQISFTALQGSNSSNITWNMWTLTPSKTTYTTYSNGTIANGATGYDNTYGDFIGSGQAFFVEAKTTGSGTVTFQESHKIGNALPNTQYYGTANSKIIRVGLKSASSDPIDEAVLRFNNYGSKSYSPDWDAATMGSASQSIAALKGSTRYAIATFPDNIADTTALSVNGTTGTFHLSITGVETLDSTQTITLRDKFLSTSQDLRANPVYAFNVTSDTASKGNNRFDIVFGMSSGTLPVNFTSITATENGGGVAVKWKVAQETNIAAYSVERSVDGVSFAPIATIKTTGSNSYSIQDNQLPTASALYYRIKAVEQSGTGKYSGVAKVTLAAARASMVIYPNPVKTQLNLSLSHASSNGSYTVRVVTVAGIEVLRQAVQMSGTGISINASTLASGVYMAELTNANGDKWMEKFVKE
ncbi:T9SS type A sorting domain-containing protein [Parasediminibacterium sp. JCM 36343]|uniref:T9SS type A sorting domain-containing protein n=1 Tax=Parasediminibacterium sp. JCM 36343 TaxID=3374279 RepID=UPI00397DC353